jgi:hypothetical protein
LLGKQVLLIQRNAVANLALQFKELADNATAASAATFTLALNGTAMATTAALAANSIATFDIKQVLSATNTITGGASAVTVNFHISGVEIS